MTKKELSGIENHNRGIEATLVELDRHDIIKRIWNKDHTVWKQDPAEIANRLGWLDITDTMRGQLHTMQSFSTQLKKDAMRHVVLLGMGGSSLGAEVLRQIMGGVDTFPQLIVLDSMVPAAVQAVTDAIDPARTLFLVSSKSGTTTEPLALYQYFRSLVEEVRGHNNTGQNFAAITDAGTPLAKMAEEHGFRHAFLNPPEIGGRYSVLSYFGLVPAVLVGINIETLLDRADAMKERCHSGTRQNPGARLGAYMGTMARTGRDKLTLITSPSLSNFGLWVEQLLAESTGKEGKGIVPVVGEPVFDAELYGNDRSFVYLRLDSDHNTSGDRLIEQIMASGQPVLILKLMDKFDLGAEFFRWEFATAITGKILGINPFDQPNVQSAKDATERVLQQYVSSGKLPAMTDNGSVIDLLSGGERGKYFSIMAYIRQTAETDEVLADLRKKITSTYGIATTLGYGPRFLHSTGQLHKGGPDSGLFMQITAEPDKDIPVPGKPYTFGVIADAQAFGDFEALKALGKSVIRTHVRKSDGGTVASLVEQMGI